MRKIFIIIALGIIIFLPIAGYFYLKTKISSLTLLNIGEKAPYFKLKTIKGKVFDFKDYTGKKILLIFFKINCHYCIKQLANLNIIRKKIGNTIEIIGISENNENKTKKFINAYNLNFPILVDDKNVFKRYKGNNVPTLYLLDEEMRIKYRRVGLRTLYFDEKILSEFADTGKIPIEVYSNNKTVFSDSVLKVKEIILTDPKVKNFIKENFSNPEEKIIEISIKWTPQNKKYKVMVKIIERPCDCPDKKIKTVNLVKIEIDPRNGRIINREFIKELSKELYKEELYQELIKENE